MFIGREKELKKLNELYHQDSFQFAVIYGRRRVGKTTLINKFIQEKSAIYFAGVEENANDNLLRFSRAIDQYENKLDSTAAVFTHFEDALRRIAKIAQTKKVVLAIDEYPYLAASYPAISSILQSIIDQEYLKTKLFLLLCGSSMSFMEHQVLGYKSPLYGRRTTQMKILPFIFYETKCFFPKMEKEEIFKIHSITGGIPQYLSFMSQEKSLAENIRDCFLDTDTYLFEEPGNLLKHELREPANYNSVLQTIANGATKQNEIAMKTQIASSSLTKYLNNLINLGIIEKVIPITEENHPRTKRTLYRISDGMFRFWYTFIGKNIDFIERGLSKLVWQAIDVDFAHFLGSSFEELSREFLWKNIMDTKIVCKPFARLGTWWGTDHKEKKESEIDIMGYDSEELIGYFGECKWRKKAVSLDVLHKLIYQSELFSYPQKELYLFSKSGFTNECKKLAEKVNCKLISFKEM